MTSLLTGFGDPPYKLHLGCGEHKMEAKEGEPRWINIDIVTTEAADLSFDLGEPGWPFPDESVIEAFSSHTLEHLEAKQRIVFLNELYRVLQFGGKALIITPHWKSPRAFQDPTHKWPPIPPEFYLYANKEWRVANKLDHYLGISSDFDFTYGEELEPEWQNRSVEAHSFAVKHYTSAARDLHVNLLKNSRNGQGAANEPRAGQASGADGNSG